jgi:TonB family protein
MIERKKRSSSKVNLVVSVVFHTLAIGAIIFFAAREGILGKKLKELTVTMVPKEKKPEPPKEKPPEPKIEPPKPADLPKPVMAAAPKPAPTTASAPTAAPIAAPAPASLPSFDFSDGAKDVQTISDANGLYKALVEHALLSRWNRPDNMADDSFVAEVKLTVDSSGSVTGYSWVSGSGNPRWDNSVKDALAQTKRLSKAPPKGFPPSFNVRFDVESLKTENLQLSSR